MSQPPRTLFEKIWDEHVVTVEPDSPAVLYIDLHLVHEVTSPQAFTLLRERGLKVRRPDKTLATMDHSIPTTDRSLPIADPMAARQVQQLAENCREFGIPLYDMHSPRQGIVHVIGPELGLTQPGMTIVCGDSHTATHGAFGALAFGIGTSEVAHVMATQCLLQRKPKTFEVRVEGQLQPGVTAKDIILALIATIGVGGGTGHVLEYTGSAIRSLSMEGRMTVCNMSIEAGARAGMVAPDDTTFEYLAGRPFAPQEAAWDAALARWRQLSTDPDATYDRSVTLDASGLDPMITYGTNPGMGMPITGRVPDPDALPDPSQRLGLSSRLGRVTEGVSKALLNFLNRPLGVEALAGTTTTYSRLKALLQHFSTKPSKPRRIEANALRKALSYMDLRPGQPLIGHPIDVVFIGSCTNGRLSDLRLAASLLDGRRVKPGVRGLVVPGSQRIKRQAEAEGLDQVFQKAGFEWREPGCSMCIAMNGDELQPGQYCVSTSNRNFEGRQGKGGRTFLASPLTAAASAVEGVVADPRELMN